MNIYNKLILYKTVIRSHIDYGVPVIHYNQDVHLAIENGISIFY